MGSLFSLITLSLLMSLIALVGAVTLFLPKEFFKKIIIPLVALAAGTLIGTAFFQLLPESITILGNNLIVYILLTSGFITFYILEQFLNWHHRHLVPLQHKPVSYLILIADSFHNLIDGFAFGAAYLIDPQLGIVLWLALALHEIPQELGDFGILIYSNWQPKSAILFNLISALTFPLGALIAYLISTHFNIALVIPFAAGSFIYIGAVDLIPQLISINKIQQINQLMFFLGGLILVFYLSQKIIT